MIRATPSSPSPRSPPQAKRIARDVAPATGLASLPPFLARSILLLDVSIDYPKKITLDNALRAKLLENFAAVSKQWRALAVDATSDFALRSSEVFVRNACRSELLEVRRQLTLQRGFVEQLDIREIPKVGLVQADQWMAVLSCAPRLLELKLDVIPGKRRAELGAIVHAAGRQCRRLDSLLVSWRHGEGGEGPRPRKQVRHQLSDPVYYVMKRAFRNTNGVGLRTLRVTMHDDIRSLASTRKYIGRVLRYCPNLECFDGYSASVDMDDFSTTLELWFMDFDLWTRFCATMTNLKEFEWICVPFATRFFEIFGQHPKPNMTSLGLMTPINWPWDRFFRELGPAAQKQLTETGYACTTRNAHAALRACPNLMTLTIYWHREQLSTSLLTPAIPMKTVMDPELFGDEFWEVAAQLCPHLTEVRCLPIIDTTPSLAVKSFTDRSLYALARLPHLELLMVDFVSVTCAGLFELVVNHEASTNRARYFQISLGDPSVDSTDTRFYDAITDFLAKVLAADAPLKCMGRRVTLTLTNRREWTRGMRDEHTTALDTEWTETYMTHLKQLITQVKDKHVGVAVKVVARDCDGTSFSQINNFSFRVHDDWSQETMNGYQIVADSIWNKDPEYGRSMQHEHDDGENGENGENGEDEEDGEDGETSVDESDSEGDAGGRRRL